MSCIHHLNSGLNITLDIYINGYFILLFELTPDRDASEGNTSHPEYYNIRIELKCKKPYPKRSRTC